MLGCSMRETLETVIFTHFGNIVATQERMLCTILTKFSALVGDSVLFLYVLIWSFVLFRGFMSIKSIGIFFTICDPLGEKVPKVGKLSCTCHP